MYDLETFKKGNAITCCVCLYQISKIADESNGDLTDKEFAKCKKNDTVFDGIDCVDKMMVWLSGLKGEPRKVGNKNIESNLELLAHEGSRFDTWVALNNLSNWYRITNIIKNGNGIISLKVFNRNVKISEKKTFLKIKLLYVE